MTKSLDKAIEAVNHMTQDYMKQENLRLASWGARILDELMKIKHLEMITKK